MAKLVPGPNVLTKAQFLTALKVTTSDAALATGIVGAKARWRRFTAGTGGPIDGVDFSLSVIKHPTILTPTEFMIGENQVATIALLADKEGTWSLVTGTGSDDNSKFTLNSSAQTLTLPAQNYEAPTDTGSNNTYSARVRFTDFDGLFVEEVIVGTIENAQGTPYTQEQIDALKLVGDNVGSAQINTSAASLDVPVRVKAGANQILVVNTQTQDSTLSSVTSVSYAGRPLTRLISVDGGVSSRLARQEVWYLKNPPVGSANVTLTLPAEDRLNVEAIVLTDVDTSIDPVYLGAINTSNTSGNYSADFTVPFPDALIIGAIAHDMNATPVGFNLKSGMNLVNYHYNTGTPRMGIQFQAFAANAGPITLGYEGLTNGSIATSRYGFLISVAFKSVPHREADPHYWVNNVTGSDLNDGSEAAPFKTLDPIVGLSPVPPGFILNLEGGQVHRRTTYTAGKDVLSLISQAGASAANPVTIQSVGTGKAMISGTLPYTTGWTSATEAETNATALAKGAQKRTMGTGFSWANFPTIDDKMHYPCAWSPNGDPTAHDSFYETFVGSNSTYFPPSNDVQVGDTFDPTKKVRWSKDGDDLFTIEIEHPALETHYGSTGPVGALIQFRREGNWVVTAPISEYISAGTASYIRFYYQDWQPHQLSVWNILCHPKDLKLKGTYAWSTDAFSSSSKTMYVLWRTGTTKAVSRYQDGIQLTGNHWRMNNVIIGQTSGVGGNSDSTAVFGFGGNGHKYNGLHITQNLNPFMTNCIGVGDSTGGATGAEINNTEFSESPTHSAWRLRTLYSSTINGFKCRKMGRTLLYFGGNANGNIAQDGDMCEHQAVHGNVYTNYQNTFNNEMRNCIALGSNLAITAQIEPANPATIPASKQSKAKNTPMTGNRPYTTAPTATYVSSPLARIDGGDTDCLYDRMLLALCGDTGIGFYVQFRAGPPAVYYPDSGTLVNRSIFHSIGFSQRGSPPVKAGTGLTLKNTLVLKSVYGGTGLAGAESWTGYGGATVVNTDIDTNEVFNGYLTTKMWQTLSRNYAGDGYESFTFGPSTYGWTFPAFGSTFTPLDVAITTNSTFEGHQAGKAIGSVYRLMPNCVPKIQEGHAANDTFFMDRGVLVAKVNLVAGTYSVPIVQTCADPLSTQISRTNTITITVLAV